IHNYILEQSSVQFFDEEIRANHIFDRQPFGFKVLSLACSIKELEGPNVQGVSAAVGQLDLHIEEIIIPVVVRPTLPVLKLQPKIEGRSLPHNNSHTESRCTRTAPGRAAPPPPAAARVWHRRRPRTAAPPHAPSPSAAGPVPCDRRAPPGRHHRRAAATARHASPAPSQTDCSSGTAPASPPC